MILDEVLNEFVGKTITVINQPFERKGVTYSQYTLDPNTEPTVIALHKICGERGLALRIWLPDTLGMCDFRTDRLNVYGSITGDLTWTIERLAFG